MVLSLVLGLAPLAALIYLFWPKATLTHRRGSVYRASFDEMVVVRWDFWVFPVEVVYVKCRGSYYVADTTSPSLADLGRLATKFETGILDDLLYVDLRTLTVGKILDSDNILILTAAGAKFDLECEQGSWQYRHNGKSVGIEHEGRINRELRKRQSALIVTRSNRNAF